MTLAVDLGRKATKQTNKTKQITVALKHEERRCEYLSSQAKIMTTVYDDNATLPEVSIESPYGNILERSQQAQHLSQY